MVREFKLPDVGEGVAEGEIVQWLVAEGDTVSEDQPVAEVETDKAIVEVPAPVNGTVREILADEGEVVPVGNVIITFDVEGEPVEEQTEAEAERAAEAETDSQAEQASEPEGVEAEAGEAGGTQTADMGEAEETATARTDETPEGRVFAPPSARRLARELGVDIAAVEGSGPGGRITEGDVRAAAEGGDGSEPATEPETPTEPAAEASADASAAEPAAPAEPTGSAGAATGRVESADRDRTLAAPATRRLAREQGVDLNAVPATEERDGEAFVTPEAVMEYAEAQQAAQAADAEAATAAAEPTEREERIPYRGVRRKIGEQMERSKFTAPHVTHHETFDVSKLVETRGELKSLADERGVKLTYMPFVMRALVAALKEFPMLNATLDEEAEEIIQKRYYNVGIAVATDAGLMVPVLEDADGKDMLQLASETNELAQKARERSISVEELQGSTITITNFGAIGGEYATPIINYPEVAILGLGAIEKRPVVVDDEVEARHTLPVSIAIDHRVVDGAEVAAFASELKRYLENPNLLLLE
jgi:pyruvate dehydrogenase E2 component (dihydrolipoamide acetyltransferase)